MKKIDARTLALLQQIRQQKKEISELSNPRWRTKCVFVDGKTEYNLHVLGVNDLIYVHSLLAEKERAYIASAKALGYNLEEYPFLWQGCSFSDWQSDIILRLKKIDIECKKSKLASLEAKLNSVMTPELLAELALREIEEELK